MEFHENPRGWLKRQNKAKARRRAKNSEEMQRIRALRRAHREETERALAEQSAEEAFDEPQQELPGVVEAPAASDGDGTAQQPGAEDAYREEMIATLRANGYKIPPGIKTETLERKMAELEASTSDA